MNIQFKLDYVDSSGVRIVYTPTKRQYDGAILEVGSIVGDWLLLPSGQSSIIDESICPGACTQGVNSLSCFSLCAQS